MGVRTFGQLKAMKSINDKGMVKEYLTYLVHFADELRAKDQIQQEDIARLNMELDEFVQKLKTAEASCCLIQQLEATRIPAVETDSTRPRNIAFYIFVIFFFGWVGLIFAGHRERRNSELCRMHLGQFRSDIIEILADEK